MREANRRLSPVATATSPEASYALSQAYRAQQNRLGVLVAALVAAYYKNLVTVEDPASVARWLEIMVPRILAGSARTASLAAEYATAVRALELPDVPRLTFEPSIGALEQQVRTSLAVVGPTDYMNKALQIERADIPDIQRKAELAVVKQVTADKIAATTLRHVANGGRQTILDSTKADGLALGYVRVTQANPCWFCAMLASRGLVFADDSFADSDPRFTGPGTAKVHDGCGCGMKAVYTRKGDKALEATQPFADQWQEWGAGGGGRVGAALRFRRGYEHFQKTGERLPWDVVNDTSAYLARNAA